MTPQAFNQMIQADITRMMKPTNYVAKCIADDGEVRILNIKAYSVDDAYEQAYEQTEGFCDTGEVMIEVDKGQYDEPELDDYEGYHPHRRQWASI
jgi:hypothetical protein